MISKIIGSVNNYIYSYVLIIMLVAVGLFFTIRSRFAQFTMIKEQIRIVGEKPSDKKGVSSFGALMVSTASRVGTGNIIGVSTALCLGGFGSVFWMWVIAIIGGASAFVESTLAQIYKKRGADGCYGGPAYYIETALKCRPLAIVFSCLLIITYGVGFNMLASYNLQSTFEVYSFYNYETPWIIGGIIAVLVGYCLFGGGSRIARITGFLVPIMGVSYVIISLVAMSMNITLIPSVFKTIFVEAFDFRAIFGGFSGSCIMYGIKRGLFSNEAGVGSAPNASATADVSHPTKQGLVQILSVFIDTILICTATALMCMCSGVQPNKKMAGAQYVQESLRALFGDFGPIFITVAMILFAFTTLLGNLYYVNQAWYHILGRNPSKQFNNVYYTVASALIFIGAGLNAGLLWDFADVCMGLMAIINIPVIILLSPQAFRALNDYKEQKKLGLKPEFRASKIGIKEKLDYWK